MTSLKPTPAAVENPIESASPPFNRFAALFDEHDVLALDLADGHRMVVIDRQDRRIEDAPPGLFYRHDRQPPLAVTSFEESRRRDLLRCLLATLDPHRCSPTGPAPEAISRSSMRGSRRYRCWKAPTNSRLGKSITGSANRRRRN